MSSFASLGPRYRLLPVVLLATRATALFQTGSSPAIQDPFLNPPPTACLVHQDGATSDTFPWTHNPTCVDAVLPSPEGDGHQGTHRDFCVYTNAAYNSGRGLSLITTPETAAEITADVFSPYFDDTPNLNAPWEMKKAKGKGQGLFATRPIQAGDTMILKSPVLFVSKDVLATPSRARKNLLLRTAVEQLPGKSRDAIMGLSTGWRGGEEDVGDVQEELIGDLVSVNAVPVRIADGTEHLTLVPEAARINHACRPNASYRFNDYTLAFDVFALRDIQLGDELTFSYGFSYLPHDERRHALEAHWGFPCSCALCTAPTANRTASDVRLKDIAAIKAALPTGPDALPKLLSFLPELISLMEQEGLVLDLPMYEEILAYTWSAFGIEKRAKDFAGRARRGWEIVAGRDSWEARRCGELEANVKAHYTFMSWEGEDPWEGVGKGHPWFPEDEDDHDHDHDHSH